MNMSGSLLRAYFYQIRTSRKARTLIFPSQSIFILLKIKYLTNPKIKLTFNVLKFNL